MSSNILSRLTRLEAENVALQEEILSLKKQLTNASLSPKHPRDMNYDTSPAESSVAELRRQVEHAVDELRKYRV